MTVEGILASSFLFLTTSTVTLVGFFIRRLCCWFSEKVRRSSQTSVDGNDDQDEITALTSLS